MERHDLVHSLEYLVSNGRQVLLGGIRLGGIATRTTATAVCPDYRGARLAPCSLG